jgi:hypothetical protein
MKMSKKYIVFDVGLNLFLKSKGFISIIDEESKEDGTCYNKDNRAYWRYEFNERFGKHLENAIHNEQTKREIKMILDEHLESKSNYKGANVQ